MSCDVNTAGDLEAYAFGECNAQAARAVEAHLFGCAACAAELRRLRGERRLFRARLERDSAPVPAFDGVLARIQEQGAAPLRVASGRSRALVSTAVAAVALAAAFAGLRFNGAPGPGAPPLRGEADGTEIAAEAVCEGGAQVSLDPSASLTTEPSSAMGAMARVEDEPGACGTAGRAGDVCGSAEPAMTYECSEAVAWCSGRP